MKRIVATYSFILLTTLSTTSNATHSLSGGVHESQPYSYEIRKDRYKFSDLYRIKSPQKDPYLGSIKKSAFRIRTNYDLSNEDGWQATGITRVVSLGSIYSWAKDIDIYDTRGIQIGMIDGELATLESAKFSIYDYDENGKSNKLGVAYANANFTRFVILSSEGDNNPIPIAEINRHSAKQNWNVSVNYPEKIDDRIIRIFSGFIIDYQNKFLSST